MKGRATSRDLKGFASSRASFQAQGWIEKIFNWGLQKAGLEACRS